LDACKKEKKENQPKHFAKKEKRKREKGPFACDLGRPSFNLLTSLSISLILSSFSRISLIAIEKQEVDERYEENGKWKMKNGKRKCIPIYLEEKEEKKKGKERKREEKRGKDDFQIIVWKIRLVVADSSRARPGLQAMSISFIPKSLNAL